MQEPQYTDMIIGSLTYNNQDYNQFPVPKDACGKIIIGTLTAEGKLITQPYRMLDSPEDPNVTDLLVLSKPEEGWAQAPFFGLVRFRETVEMVDVERGESRKLMVTGGFDSMQVLHFDPVLSRMNHIPLQKIAV